MAVEYVKDPSGIVHVIASGAGYEFTLCARPLDGDTVTGGFLADKSSGPANCADCHEHLHAIREAAKGARWSKNLRSPDHA